uniref:Proteasome 26S subunit, ATPase 4 n=13 Tax=Euteleostomi TaxID=117571 RepID=A0A8C3BI06_CAIMO
MGVWGFGVNKWVSGKIGNFVFYWVGKCFFLGGRKTEVWGCREKNVVLGEKMGVLGSTRCWGHPFWGGAARFWGKIGGFWGLPVTVGTAMSWRGTHSQILGRNEGFSGRSFGGGEPKGFWGHLGEFWGQQTLGGNRGILGTTGGVLGTPRCWGHRGVLGTPKFWGELGLFWGHPSFGDNWGGFGATQRWGHPNMGDFGVFWGHLKGVLGTPKRRGHQILGTLGSFGEIQVCFGVTEVLGTLNFGDFGVFWGNSGVFWGHLGLGDAKFWGHSSVSWGHWGFGDIHVCFGAIQASFGVPELLWSRSAVGAVWPPPKSVCLTPNLCSPPPQEELPALAVPRPPAGLNFLVPEPEDLEDLYSRYKKLQQELEFLEVQEEYIKDEQKNLKKEFLHAQEEVKRIQSIPLVIGQFLEAVDQNTAIVGSTTGSNYYVRILSTIDRELLKPNASVALHKHSNALVDVLPPEADSSIMMLTSDQKPDVMYADIGGMDIQKQEVREAVELPLTHFELYKQIGIDPPRGVLMYGPPGCGKTMLAKAVAHHTTAAFIRVVGSEFVQKYLGEGPRMVRDVFRLAKENAPAIIFIDEIDAIATKRFDAQTGGEDGGGGGGGAARRGDPWVGTPRLGGAPRWGSGEPRGGFWGLVVFGVGGWGIWGSWVPWGARHGWVARLLGCPGLWGGSRMGFGGPHGWVTQLLGSPGLWGGSRMGFGDPMVGSPNFWGP